MRTLWRAGILLLVCGSSYSICPQTKAPPTAPATTAAKPEEDSYAKEPYVFELLDTRARFEADGKGQREFTLRARIQSESAVHEFGLLAYSFASSFESLDVDYVRVRKPDGSVIDTPPSDIQEIDSAVSREAPMYTDQREKHVAVKSLSVGDVLEAHFRWTIHDPLAPGHFWYDDSYFTAGICLKEVIELNVPANVPVKLRNSDPQPVIREENGRRIYTFNSSHLKHAEESRIPDWEKNPHGAPLPDIELSSFSSWAEVGSWYDSLQREKLGATPEIRARAEELVKGKSSDDEKVRAIYDFVSTRFRYIGVDLGLGRYTPHAASDVLVNRYGDCKDKHTLFAALLQAAGIPAYPALISSKFKIDPSFASPSAFDHVITAIPRDDSFLFLDTTPEVAPFGLLIQNIRDREALVIPTAAPAELITTPAEPPMPNYERAKIEGSIDDHGTLDAKMRMEDRGDGELLLRLAYRETPQNRWQELTQRIVANMGFAGTVSEVSVTQPEDFSQPFSMSFSYHRTDYPDWKNGRIAMPSPPLLFPPLNEQQKLLKDPLPLGALQDVVYETTIKLPKDFVPLAPQDVHQKSDFAEFSARYSVATNSIHATLTLKILLHEVPGAERGKFDDLAKRIDETVRRYVFVGGDSQLAGNLGPGVTRFLAGNTKDAIPDLEKTVEEDPENKNALISLSQAYYTTGRAKDAVALLEKALAKKTDHAEELHLSLGHAYLALPDADKAILQFEQGLGDDPAPALLNEIAYGLAEANVKLAQALTYSTRAIKLVSSETMDISPDEPSRSDYNLMARLAAAWDTQGWIKFRMGDFANAEKFLHASWQLDQTPTSGEHLVEVYEKQGKTHRAAVICNMAQAVLNSSPFGTDSKLRDHLEDEMKRLGPSLRSSPAEEAVDGVHSRDGQVALVDIRSLDVHISTKMQAEASNASFLIALTNGSKLPKITFLSGSDELRSLSTVLASTKYPQTFPDEVPARILRKGTLSCSIYSQQCLLLLSKVREAGSANSNFISVPMTAASRSGGSSAPIFMPSESPARTIYDAARRAGNNREFEASAQLYERAIAIDPAYMDAWNSLGWTYNHLRRYDKAEAALRKTLALAPTARYAHNNLGEALEGQKKFAEAVPEYLKEIELNPKDPWAHENLGRVYVILKQFENAVPVLEQAASLAPDNAAIQFNLGRSYAKTAALEKAAQALNRSVELDPRPARWNAVAYEMALDKLQLDQALKYVTSAIAATIKHLNEIAFDNLSVADAQVSALLGPYWDTLGWIDFQEGNLADAEKYVTCAWQLTSFSEIGDHLAQIYEKEDRKADAIQMNAMALTAANPMPETKPRLVALLGAEGDIERLTGEARAKLAESRTVTVKNADSMEGSAEFLLVLSPNAKSRDANRPGAKVAAVRFATGDESLRPLGKELESAEVPASFPDEAEVKLVRRAKLTCVHSSVTCSLVLVSEETVRSVN